LLPTQSAGHATLLAKEASQAGSEVVFACGGDGTVNEVVNGLAGTQTALGVMRGGMGNVFLKEIGVPRSPEGALQLLLSGDRRRFDLGTANERYFLLMAGIGIDANVVRRVPDRAKRFLGSASYVIHGLLEVCRYRPKDAQLSLDGQAWQGPLYWAILGNTRSYGGVLNVTSQALADDELLDAYVFSGVGVPWVAWTLLKLAIGKHKGATGVLYKRAHEILVETPDLAVQVDGEYIGRTPMRFGVAPAALDVLLPKGKAARLFRTKA
jgi:YegS/Rv2252/BmrU family lipid kinase